MCIVSEDRECGRAILHTNKKVEELDHKVNKLEKDIAVLNVKIDNIHRTLEEVATTVKIDRGKSSDRLYQYLFWGVATALGILLAYLGLK